MYGEVGDGTNTARPTPVRIGTANDWISVDAGADFTCGVRADFSAWCWGNNNLGQLGVVGGNGQIRVPTRVTIYQSPFSRLAAGTYATCGLASTGPGIQRCWGATPGDFLGDTGSLYNAIDVGYMHVCGIRTDASLWCWGWNESGQLGDGTTTRQPTPVQVGTDIDWTVLATAGAATCGIRGVVGQLYCWGDNQFGGLGDGTTTNRLSPTPVPALP